MTADDLFPEEEEDKPRYAAYTFTVYREAGENDRYDLHDGKGGTAASILRETIMKALAYWDQYVVGGDDEADPANVEKIFVLSRKIIDALPQMMDEDPDLQDDPDPNEELFDLLTARRAMLRAEGLVDDE